MKIDEARDMDNTIIDCRYCEYCCCDSPTSKWAICYVEDECYFDHNVEDPIKEAEECDMFIYCDCFPKW